MKNLELSVTQQMGVITGNFDAIKAQLESEMAEYKGKTFTEETKKKAKEDLADLRKLKKNVNTRKLEVKKAYMKPYDDFEEKVKELICVIDEPIGLIDGQVKEFEEKRILTQPTVSAHIQTLEKELKVRLFVRNTKTVKLSEDGKTLYQYARQMIELEQEIQSMFSKAAEQKERCITIATSTIPAQYILPDILVKFRERFPEEQFRIVESDSSTVIEQVASHLVDIGFSGTVIEKANCKYIPFYQDDLVVIMPNTKEYQKIVKEQKDLKWLEGEPLIIREEGSGTRKEAEKQLKKMGISLDDLNIVATIENPEAVKRSVKSGLGITIISRLAAADEIESGEVLEFPFSQDGSGRNLNLVYNKNYKLPAAAEHVRELIIEKYELQKQSLQ